MTLPYHLPDIMQTIRMNCQHLLRRCRLETYGELTVRKKDVSVSLCSVILIF
mgnify:CR=1 FL=1